MHNSQLNNRHFGVGHRIKPELTGKPRNDYNIKATLTGLPMNGAETERR
jgi:hypothetical protein